MQSRVAIAASPVSELSSPGCARQGGWLVDAVVHPDRRVRHPPRPQRELGFWLLAALAAAATLGDHLQCIYSF